MNAGIDVFSDSGFKVAGSDYANLVLYGKYTLTVQGGEYIIFSTGEKYYWDAYAVVPVDGSVVRFFRANFEVVEQGGLARVPRDRVGQQITCYTFGPVIPSATSFGLEVWDENGKQTFNTARKFLKLKGFFYDPSNYMLDFQVGNARYPSVNTGLGAGTHAWSTGNSRYFYRQTQFAEGFTDQFESVLGVRVNDSGIYSNLAMQFGGTNRVNGFVGYGNHVPQTGPITVLVADVAGY